MTLPTVPKHDKLFIGGQWVAPHSSRTIDVINASTELPAGSVPDGDKEDIDRAVDAARAAFDDPKGWSSWEPARRADALRRLADELEKRAEQTSTLVSTQNGMPISVSRIFEVGFPMSVLRYYAQLIVDTPSETSAPHAFGGTSTITHSPIGVVGAIVPWNFPQLLASLKYAPALASGSTIVLKPSPEAVLDSFVFAEAARAAGIPDGVLNIVPGGREVGAYLVQHPKVDKVAFTGSTAAGRNVAEACARLLRPVTLELGGKSAAIILDDAKLDFSKMGQDFFAATFVNNGQNCYAATRILAPKSRYKEIVDTLAGFASSLKVGDALDPTTQIGPLASRAQRERVEGYIAKGKAEGARLVVGGGRPSSLSKGWFVEPTIFADLDNKATIAREEIFGPVFVVIPYADDADAVRIANDSDFGLGGSVWTDDLARGNAVARRVSTGTIGVNRYIPDPAAPFGGVRSSGLGREGGIESLRSYQNVKSIFS